MEPSTTENQSDRVIHSKWLILALVLAAECMDLFDGTIVNVAAPTIRLDLHSSSTALQWIIGGYALTFAVGMVDRRAAGRHLRPQAAVRDRRARLRRWPRWPARSPATPRC